MTAQTRRGDGKFRSSYSDERCYELLRLAALKVNALDPARLSQPKFDARAPEVAGEQGWPDPPKANAIYMRLTRQRKHLAAARRERAHGGDGQPNPEVGAQTRESPASWFRRAALLRPPPRPPFLRHEFGRLDLLATVRGERRAYLDLVLPTAGQIG